MAFSAFSLDLHHSNQSISDVAPPMREPIRWRLRAGIRFCCKEAIAAGNRGTDVDFGACMQQSPVTARVTRGACLAMCSVSGALVGRLWPSAVATSLQQQPVRTQRLI
jgi:hypothetical protein